MPRSPASKTAQSGQASVELVSAIPLVALLCALAWQLALAGHATWLAAHAARAAARADVVGRSPQRAARRSLPRALRRGLLVRRSGRRVEVRLRVPLLWTGRGTPLRVGASSSLGGRP